MIDYYPLWYEARWVLTSSQINLSDYMWKWEEAQWNKRHLSMGESIEIPLAEATIKVDNWNGAPNIGWILGNLL